MSCPNCKLFHSICKAECCSVAPMEQQIFARNFHKLVIPVSETMPFAPGIILPITATNKCPFLNQDLSCNIYDDRPAVCRKFGDETHINMTCCYQTKDGAERPLPQRKRIQRKQKEEHKKFFGK